MRRIGLEGHDLLLESLVKVHLASVDEVARVECTVGVQRPLRVDLDMDVDRTCGVEAREDGLHLHHAVVIGWPLATEKGRVVGVEVGHANLKVGDVELLQEGREGGVGGDAGETRVGAGGIAVPKVHKSLGEGLACCYFLKRQLTFALLFSIIPM